MVMNTAEQLYEVARELPASERLRLVERIAHDLAVPTQEAAKADGSTTGLRARTQLAGQVTDIALTPLRFTVQTGNGPVTVSAGESLLDAIRAAWGEEAIITVNAVIDPQGRIHDAEAISITTCTEADDLLACFEATFGSGSEMYATPQGQEYLRTMRGGGL